jgi:hypothetical protein
VENIRALYNLLLEAHALQSKNLQTFALLLDSGCVADVEPPMVANSMLPTTRTFTREYLREELDLPGGEFELTSWLIEHRDHDVLHGIIFRTLETPGGYAWETTYSVSTGQDEAGSWEYENEIECTLVRMGTKTVKAWLPATLPEANATPVEPSSETEPCPPPDADDDPWDVLVGDTVAPSTVPPTVDPSDVQSSRLAPVAAEETGKRAKNMTTAKEWGEGLDFLAFMKSEPFSAWTVEEQTAKRDAFVASVPADKTQNRWGRSFRKFCGGVS